MSRARALSEWVGAGKPVTARGVLRRADVTSAAAALGVPDPGWVRTAADVEVIHRPWVAADAAGLLRLGADRAVAAPPGDRDPAEFWLLGLGGVLREESNDTERIGATVLCRLVLLVLDTQATQTMRELEETVDRILEERDLAEVGAAYQAFRRGVMPVPAALELLVEFGAVDGSTLMVTPLGRWARDRLAEPVSMRPPDPVHGADHVYQLKIGLTRFRPPVWRRVLVPADTSLGRLHEIIQIVLEWEDDHLHVFTADHLHYADPFHGLEDCADENAVSLAATLPRPGVSMTYRYDLGDCWDHTIILEKVLDHDSTRTYPTCVAGRGDSPVEDWIPDSSEPAATPFDQDVLNRGLAALACSEPATRASRSASSLG